MIKFKRCPRCDKRYWLFARNHCNRCKFQLMYQSGDTTSEPFLYSFKTNRWNVDVWPNLNKTDIRSLIEKHPEEFVFGKVSITLNVPYRFTIDGCLPPKTTDDDIDKLLVLE